MLVRCYKADEEEEQQQEGGGRGKLATMKAGMLNHSEAKGGERLVKATVGHGDLARRLCGAPVSAVVVPAGIEVLRTMTKVLDVFAWSLVRCEDGSLAPACGSSGAADYRVEWSVPADWAEENLCWGEVHALPTKIVREVADRGRHTEVHMRGGKQPVVLHDHATDASQLEGSFTLKMLLGCTVLLFLDVKGLRSTVVVSSADNPLPHRRGPLWPGKTLTFEGVWASFFAWTEEEEEEDT